MINLILDFVSILVFQISEIFLFEKLIKKKRKIKLIHIFLGFLFAALQIILVYFDFKIIMPLITIFYFSYIFKSIYNCKSKESINYSAIFWIINLLWDICVMMAVNQFELIEFYERNVQICKTIGSFTMSATLFALANSKIMIRLINNIYNKVLNLKLSMNHITLIVMTYLFLGFMSSENLGDKFVVTILLIAGFAILVVIISFITMKYQLILFKKTNEILEKNDIVNRKVITQYRVLKHNLESKLMGVKTVSNDEAKQLIDEMILDYNSSFFIKHDVNAMPLGINGFVFEKLYKYQDENLDISVTNKIKNNILDSVGSRNYNLFCEALGVTLDNALEASKNSQEKLFYLEFNETNDKVTIKVINTFSGDIELDKLGTVQYTTKEKGHGFGLFSLIGRKNLTITTSIKNNRFINFLEIKKKANQETK